MDKDLKKLISLKLSRNIFSIATILIIVLELKKVIPDGFSHLSIGLAFMSWSFEYKLSKKLQNILSYKRIDILLFFIGLANIVFALFKLIK